MKLKGTKYKIGNCLLYRFNGETPVFVKVVDILFLPNKIEPVFVGQTLETTCYNQHYHAYQVSFSAAHTCSVVVFSQTHLADYHVLSLYQPYDSADIFLLPLKYYVLDDFDCGEQ